MKRRDVLAGLAAAALAPPLSCAQSSRARRIGFLVQKAGTWLVEPFSKALAVHGWAVGRSVELDLRFSASPAIVMYLSGWPVEGGLVQSYARPGGNITGLSTYGGSDKLFAKFMGLLKELLPSVREIGVVWDYVAPLFLEKEVEQGVGELKRAAEALNVRSHDWPIHGQADFDRALAAASNAPIQAIFATSGPMNSQPQNLKRLGDLALRRRLPIMSDIAGSTFRAIGTIAYSVNWNEAAARCASFVDRILRGANPAELPIEQPKSFELVLHAGRARAIGLGIPPAMLIRADRVIE
jgi:putative ABC transport system substrate-binding protein